MVLYQPAAGIIIYLIENGEPKFLLLYRDKGYWNFPKGKIEKDEKTFKAALREVREETGLMRKDLFFDNYFRVYNRYTFSVGKEIISKIVVFYLARTNKKIIRISDEHDGYAWFSYREALKVIKHKSLKPILKKAYETIRPKRKIVQTDFKNTSGQGSQLQ